MILSCVADRPQASIFSQFPSHPFAVRKCWEARPLKTVNRQLGFAKFAGQDRRFSQLARADAGALVNRSSEKIAIDSVRGRSSLSTHQRGLNVESGHADFPGDGTMKGRKACFQTKEAAEKVSFPEVERSFAMIGHHCNHLVYPSAGGVRLSKDGTALA